MLDPTVLENMLSSISQEKKKLKTRQASYIDYCTQDPPMAFPSCKYEDAKFYSPLYTEIPEDQDIAVVSKITTTPTTTGNAT